MRQRHNRKKLRGFSLIELLIVMAIILILVTIAIPTFTGVLSSAHETSAIGSIQAIGTAEVMYQSYYPQVGYACALGNLGGQGAGSTAAGLLSDTKLLSGVKDGYTFTLTCTHANSSGGATSTGDTNSLATGYLITAAPVQPGKSGKRYFCADSPSSVHYSMTPNCNPETDPSQ